MNGAKDLWPPPLLSFSVLVVPMKMLMTTMWTIIVVVNRTNFEIRIYSRLMAYKFANRIDCYNRNPSLIGAIEFVPQWKLFFFQIFKYKSI